MQRESMIFVIAKRKFLDADLFFYFDVFVSVKHFSGNTGHEMHFNSILCS